MLAAVILTVVLLMPVILIRGLALQEQLDATPGSSRSWKWNS
jgi:hypothetical protein